MYLPDLLVSNFHKQAFVSDHRRLLAKVLPWYDIPDKYIRVISVVQKNKIGLVKVSLIKLKSGVRQGCILFLFICIILRDFVLRSTAKAMGEYGIENGSKNILD